MAFDEERLLAGFERELGDCWSSLSAVRKLIERLQTLSDRAGLWRIIGESCDEFVRADGVMTLEAGEDGLLVRHARGWSTGDAPRRIDAALTREHLDAWLAKHLNATAAIVERIGEGDEPWGAIVMWRTGRAEPFAGVDQMILSLCAAQAATIVATMRTTEANARIRDWQRISGEVAGLIQDPVTLLSLWLEDLRRHLSPSVAPEFERYFETLRALLDEVDSAAARFFTTALEPERQAPLLFSEWVATVTAETLPPTVARTCRVTIADSALSSLVMVSRNVLTLGFRELLLLCCKLRRDAGTPLSVEVETRGDTVSVDVAVTTAGPIPKSARARLFDDESLLVATIQGVQFSLALARTSAQSQGGTIAEVGDGDELRVRLGFPLHRTGDR